MWSTRDFIELNSITNVATIDVYFLRNVAANVVKHGMLRH